MSETPLNLTRNQVSAIVGGDPRAVRALELLLRQVNKILPDDIQSILDGITAVGIAADNASSRISEALSQLAQLGPSSQALQSAPPATREPSITLDYLDFLGGPTPVTQKGRMFIDPVFETLNVGMGRGVLQQVGLETFARVKNGSAGTLTNGQVVGFSSGAAEAVIVTPYLADGATNPLHLLGVMTHDLESGGYGYCTVLGFVHDLNTSAFAAGDVLYASPTVAGGLTNIKPTAPAAVVPVAICLVSHATAGVLAVRPVLEQTRYYGVFLKTSDQSPAAVNTEYLLTFDTAQVSNGITLGSPNSRIIAQQSGLYQFSAAIQMTDTGGTVKNVWLWYKKNGVAIANGARITSVALGYATITLRAPISLAAGDYVEIAYATNNIAVTIDNVAATSFAPAAPAVILSVTQIQQ